MGVLVDRVRMHIPVTFAALQGDNRYGSSFFQDEIDLSKYELLGDSAPDENNESTLDLIIQSYLSKKALIKIIPSAIDYWMDQPLSVSSRAASDEVITYPNKVEVLKELLERLIKETVAMFPDIETVVDPVVRRRENVLVTSDGESEILVSQNPHEFGPAFIRPGLI